MGTGPGWPQSPLHFLSSESSGEKVEWISEGLPGEILLLFSE